MGFVEGTLTGEVRVVLAAAEGAPVRSTSGEVTIERAAGTATLAARCPEACAFAIGEARPGQEARVEEGALARIDGSLTLTQRASACQRVPILFALLFPRAGCADAECAAIYTATGRGDEPLARRDAADC